MKVTPPEGDSVTSSVLVKAVETLKFLTATGGAFGSVNQGSHTLVAISASYLFFAHGQAKAPHGQDAIFHNGAATRGVTCNF